MATRHSFATIRPWFCQHLLGLIETYGWQSVFLAAGLPVLLIPFILKTMPESMPFLIRQGRHRRAAGRSSRGSSRATAAQPATASRCRPRTRPTARRSAQLFQDGRGFSTVMFWIAFFMCLFMVYALSSWLTKLMASAGYSLGSALTFVLVLNVGAMIGAIGGGWLADRFHIKYVLVGDVCAGGGVDHPARLSRCRRRCCSCWSGWRAHRPSARRSSTYAYAGQFYPMAVRSTGIGWASGVGRSGAILAPIVIGMLVGMALPLQQNFMAIAMPAVIAVIAVC